MNRYGLWLGMVGGLLPMAGYADPTVFTDGIALDSDFNSVFGPLNSPYVGSYLTSLNGSLMIHSGVSQTARQNWDGGITLMADPVNVLLSVSSDVGNTDRGTFAVWGEAEYYGSATKPFFQVKSPENIAAFDSVDVTVTNGSLSVGGSPVLTAGGLNAALSTATPPTSAAWKAAYVPRGIVSNGGYLSLGGSASAIGAVVLGDFFTTASGQYSFASGDTTLASGMHSMARGFNTNATGAFSTAWGSLSGATGTYATAIGLSASASGSYSTAIGSSISAQSISETVFGRHNKTDASTQATSWFWNDALFRIGNGGSSSDKSDAIIIRKHGETTLTNKFWKANSSAPLADPTEANDAGGSALVVDGHTTLNGKVTITAPQGDISMGIYQ